ncbi:ribosomal protein S18-alanine N-acetyltransferase [Leuconostocaceae bacterium ESL0723]|nr:ribosomal protein S18-alanine N-acetyltransferase [Leuconostocaceae bacterium ESL0723]
MKIRQATIEDADKIFEIAQAAFNPSPWPKRVFVHELKSPRSTYWLSEAGFVGTTQILDEVEIGCLAVDPSHQGRGEGRLLMETVMAYYPGARFLLEVAADNLPAQCLYQQLGFSTYHRRKRYYRNGQDALLMEKTG